MPRTEGTLIEMRGVTVSPWCGRPSTLLGDKGGPALTVRGTIVGEDMAPYPQTDIVDPQVDYPSGSTGNLLIKVKSFANGALTGTSPNAPEQVVTVRTGEAWTSYEWKCNQYFLLKGVYIAAGGAFSLWNNGHVEGVPKGDVETEVNDDEDS